MKTNRRRRKLILPKLQLGMLASFFLTTSLVLGFQFLMVARIISQVSSALPSEAEAFRNEVNGALVRVGVLSLLMLVPLALLVGIASTFRVAGPLYRIKVWLGQLLAGETAEPCRLRSSDDAEMHEICELINRAAHLTLQRNQADSPSERPQVVVADEPAGATLADEESDAVRAA